MVASVHFVDEEVDGSLSTTKISALAFMAERDSAMDLSPYALAGLLRPAVAWTLGMLVLRHFGEVSRLALCWYLEELDALL